MLGVSQFLLMVCFCWQEVPIELLQVQSAGPERGSWQGIDAENVTIQVGGQSKSIPLAALRSVKFVESTKQSAQDVGSIILLNDGTRILPMQVTGKGQDVVLELSSSLKLQVPANHIRSVQFQKLTEKQLPQWRAIQESRLTADTLVVIRSADALDKIEGQILEINAERVVFEFNKQKIEAPRSKLAGLRFLTPPVQNQRIKAIVTDLWGNVYQAVQVVSTSSASLDMTLSCGAKISLPVGQLANIDFSVGSIKYVAEMAPLGNDRVSGFAAKIPVAGADQLFAPQPVKLPQSNGPSLKMLGSGSVTYRVPDEYTSVAGKVYLAPEGEQFTPCTIELRLENEVLWQGKLKHPTDRLEFSVPVVADKRLQLNVQADSSYPVGDVVMWQELRMMK